MAEYSAPTRPLPAGVVLPLFTPVLVDANRQHNIYDDQYGTKGTAVFADYLIIASFSRRF